MQQTELKGRRGEQTGRKEGQMTAAELMVRCLENEGVRYIFGIPGEENIDLVHALSCSRQIRFVEVRHEQGAAFMADVYGRLTGQAGVCLATLGPGATNLLTGVGDAQLDRAPLVALAGQAEMERMHKESHQHIDTVSLFQPVTKWAVQVKVPETIPEIIRKAFKLAQMEKPGAVYVELPEDVAVRQAEGRPLPVTPNPVTVPAPEQLDRAVQAIEQSRKPFIIAGNGVVRGRAWEELRHLAEKLGVPVANTFMAKGILPPAHPQTMYTVGLQLRDYVLCGIEEADLVIAAGYDFVEYLPMYWNGDRPRPILHIDSQAAEVDACYPVVAELVGDMALSLKGLAERISFSRKWQPAGDLHQKLQEELYLVTQTHVAGDGSEERVKPQALFHELSRTLPEETILISDVGAHKLWLARMYQPGQPNRTIISNGFAAMGIAVPGAIGAKLACPDHPVVCVTGDGGFMMNAAELETARRLGLSFVVLVLSDGKYGVIDWKMKDRFGHSYGIHFANPDLVQLAESFGATGMRVNSAREWPEVLRQALATEGLVLVEVPFDDSENLRLSQHLGKLVCRQ